MTNIYNLLNSTPIYIATQEYQCRTHRKKRINKKWRKRYGCYEINKMPHGQVIMTDDGVMWMTKRTFEKLKGAIYDKKTNNRATEIFS